MRKLECYKRKWRMQINLSANHPSQSKKTSARHCIAAKLHSITNCRHVFVNASILEKYKKAKCQVTANIQWKISFEHTSVSRRTHCFSSQIKITLSPLKRSIWITFFSSITNSEKIISLAKACSSSLYTHNEHSTNTGRIDLMIF